MTILNGKIRDTLAITRATSMTRIPVLLLSALSALTEAQTLNVFSNGSVARADEVNENFQTLNDKIDALAPQLVFVDQIDQLIGVGMDLNNVLLKSPETDHVYVMTVKSDYSSAIVQDWPPHYYLESDTECVGQPYFSSNSLSQPPPFTQLWYSGDDGFKWFEQTTPTTVIQYRNSSCTLVDAGVEIGLLPIINGPLTDLGLPDVQWPISPRLRAPQAVTTSSN